MVLDTSTLRVSLAVVTLTLLFLFFFITYRKTRSAYSAWWCSALLLFLTGSASYLLDGTVHQEWANPLGNTLLVGGAGAMWAGARSLRYTSPKIWYLIAGPVLTGLVSIFDSPATNNWSGGPVMLGFMALMLGLSSRELFLLEVDYSRVHRPLAYGSALLTVFYVGRLVVFLLQGPNSPVFETYFGSVVTTILTTMVLVVASFTMVELSNEQLTRDLRSRATMDGLTGLLNRTAFMDLAAEELRRLSNARTPAALVLADLDHFKTVNDRYGHAAGDVALQAFAEACTESVRSTDLVGRYGGEEFILLLPGVSPERAEDMTAAISRRLQEKQPRVEARLPTVSYGITATGTGRADLKALVECADAALYRAKTQGRDQSVLAATLREEETAGTV
ncbi:GGDEF domain-containing protein [Arthrobacter sp. NPDC057259]|uniref:GGDEF domain-containing protein n=1 Tax=Arthrobacter sp. NPDC057259 TaxID=3346073 RepID=UPI0036446BC4